MTPKHFVKDADIAWSKATTLEETVIKLIEEKKTKEPEFQALLEFWGREKLESIWRNYVKEKR